MNPRISVIMGVYNQKNKEQLTAAVDSILVQTENDFEFIIYDDGSEEIASSYIRELAGKDERIRVIGKEENHGLAFSLNACIKEARGTYIARMDADDVSYPERLARQVAFLEENKTYAWVGCNAKLMDENGIWGQRNMPQTPEYEDYLRFSPYIHPTVVYRREIFENHEGYVASEETLRCEDYEIFMRLRQLGYRGYNLQEYLFEYREDRSSYAKRKWKYRVNEARLRYRNFKKMGILFPKGWLYVLRPIVGFFVPNGLIRKCKKAESDKLQHKEKGFDLEQYAARQYAAERVAENM